MSESLFKKSYRPESCNLIEKETPAQVFSCEFCKFSIFLTADKVSESVVFIPRNRVKIAVKTKFSPSETRKVIHLLSFKITFN